MRTIRALLFGVSLSAMSFGVPLPAYAQGRGTASKESKDTESAKKLFDEGTAAENAGEFATALARYKEAEQIAVTPGIKFHKGYCLEQLNKLVAALDEYEQADKLARTQNRTDVQAAVKARLDPLKARIPSISIHLVTSGSDATVQLDTTDNLPPERLHGTDAIRVDPGEHDVRAHATGFKNFVRHVKLEPGQSLVVEVALEPVPPPPPKIIDPPEEEAKQRSLVAPIATTAGAVALITVGTVLFVVSGSRQSEQSDTCKGLTTCDSSNTQTTIRTFDALALAGWLGGAALGVTAVVLWTRTGKSAAPAAAGMTLKTAGPRLLLEGSF